MKRAPIPLSLLADAAMSRRSALYRWMLENHDGFAAVVAQAGRPNWQALAEAFGAQGYTDSGDEPPSAEVTRQTWWKVRKTVQLRAARALTKPPPKPTQQPVQVPIPPPSRRAVLPQPVPAPRAVLPPLDDDDDAPPTFESAREKD